ncbi:hypothetical protein [Microbulbifer sp. S227A]
MTFAEKCRLMVLGGAIILGLALDGVAVEAMQMACASETGVTLG